MLVPQSKQFLGCAKHLHCAHKNRRFHREIQTQLMLTPNPHLKNILAEGLVLPHIVFIKFCYHTRLFMHFKRDFIWKMEDIFCQLFFLAYMYTSIVPSDFQGGVSTFEIMQYITLFFGSVHSFTVYESSHVINCIVHVMKCSKEILR